MSMPHETFERILADLRNSSEGQGMTDEDLYDEAYRRMHLERSDNDIVREYYVSLVIGAVVIFVLWGVLLTLTSNIPQFYKSVIGIVLFTVTALMQYDGGIFHKGYRAIRGLGRPRT